MTRRAAHSSWWMIALLVVSCGSGPAAHAPAQTEGTSGQETSPAPVAAPAEASEPAAVPEREGPAAVTVEAKVHGKAVDAAVRLLGPDGGEVASGKTGQPLTVTSGEYEMLVQVTDSAAMLDKPTQRRPLTLHAGDNLHESVEFPWAMIQLNVIINGSPARDAVVHLSKQGAEVGTLKSGAEPVPVSPGRYEAEVKTKGASIQVKGLMFPEGATQTVPVNVQL